VMEYSVLIAIYQGALTACVVSMQECVSRDGVRRSAYLVTEYSVLIAIYQGVCCLYAGVRIS